MAPKIITITVVASLVGAIGLALILTSGQKQLQPTQTFSPQDVDRPRVETTETFTDLGEIKLTDVKRQEYTLRNAGTKPLQILNINTSCGCTAGQIIYNGETSKEYSMHAAKSGLITEIAPGDTATVRLTYRPASMPVYGPVEREVYVTTNDPDNQRLVFSIKATVK